MNIFKRFNIEQALSAFDRLLNVIAQCILAYFVADGFYNLYQSSDYFSVVKYISFIILLFMAFIYLNRDNGNV